MSSQPLLLVGAGGFAQETLEAVRACGDQFELRGVLDDDPSRHGSLVLGVPVLGGTDQIAAQGDAQLVVTTGRPDDYGSRARIVARLDLAPSRYATVVHPSAWLAPSVTLGHGTVVLAGVVATADVTVGAHVAVMPAVVLTHGDVVEDFVTLASGVRLGGGVRISEGAYLGAGALVRENLCVGAGSMIGMGGVVVDTVPAGELWMGCPARPAGSVATSWRGAAST